MQELTTGTISQARRISERHGKALALPFCAVEFVAPAFRAAASWTWALLLFVVSLGGLLLGLTHTSPPTTPVSEPVIDRTRTLSHEQTVALQPIAEIKTPTTDPAAENEEDCSQFSPSLVTAWTPKPSIVSSAFYPSYCVAKNEFGKTTKATSTPTDSNGNEDLRRTEKGRSFGYGSASQTQSHSQLTRVSKPPGKGLGKKLRDERKSRVETSAEKKASAENGRKLMEDASHKYQTPGYGAENAQEDPMQAAASQSKILTVEDVHEDAIMGDDMSSQQVLIIQPVKVVPNHAMAEDVAEQKGPTDRQKGAPTPSGSAPDVEMCDSGLGPRVSVTRKVDATNVTPSPLKVTARPAQPSTPVKRNAPIPFQMTPSPVPQRPLAGQGQSSAEAPVKRNAPTPFQMAPPAIPKGLLAGQAQSSTSVKRNAPIPFQMAPPPTPQGPLAGPGESSAPVKRNAPIPFQMAPPPTPAQPPVGPEKKNLPLPFIFASSTHHQGPPHAHNKLPVAADAPEKKNAPPPFKPAESQNPKGPTPAKPKSSAFAESNGDAHFKERQPKSVFQDFKYDGAVRSRAITEHVIQCLDEASDSEPKITHEHPDLAAVIARMEAMHIGDQDIHQKHYEESFMHMKVPNLPSYAQNHYATGFVDIHAPTAPSYPLNEEEVTEIESLYDFDEACTNCTDCMDCMEIDGPEYDDDGDSYMSEDSGYLSDECCDLDMEEFRRTATFAYSFRPCLLVEEAATHHRPRIDSSRHSRCWGEHDMCDGG